MSLERAYCGFSSWWGQVLRSRVALKGLVLGLLKRSPQGIEGCSIYIYIKGSRLSFRILRFKKRSFKGFLQKGSLKEPLGLKGSFLGLL